MHGRSTVYVSLPLTGPQASAGRDVLRGAELAAEQVQTPVGLAVLDSFADDREERAAANAHRAAADPAAVAYLGDYHSSQVAVTAPIAAAAGLLQVAPVATQVWLGGPTLVLLAPDDRAGARAIADWLVAAGVRNALVVHDHDDGYGIPVGAMCAEAARDRGVDVRTRPVWDHDEPIRPDAADVDAVVYVGVAGSGAAALWHELHEANPTAWLLGSDGVATDRLARALAPDVAERTRFFVPFRAPTALYGFEAMALIVAAAERSGGDRRATAAAVRATRDRRSVIGTYSIDEHGRTTSRAYGRQAVVGGRLVWDNAPGRGIGPLESAR